MSENDKMNTTRKGLALLPNGFADILPPRAESEAHSLNLLMSTFKSYGYQRVKPPLLEFEESLLAPGVGECLARETFRLMDPVSHRMLGVRSDVTPQIARIVSSRMENAPRPLRLTYANDVLRNRGSQIRTERQFTQAGCEIIGGGDHIDSDIEICVLAIVALKALGIGKVTIDMTIPNFAARIIDRAQDEDADALRQAIARRDYDALAALNGGAAHKLAAAMQARGAYEKALSALSGITLDHDIAQDVVRLIRVCDGVVEALGALAITDVSITVDVLEQAGFEYHNGFGFTLFSEGSNGELGRGGAYDVRFGADEPKESAKGFTLYMDTIGKICAPAPTDRKIYVLPSEGWDVLSALQGQGWITIRGNAPENAEKYGCSHLYKDGKIVETSN